MIPVHNKIIFRLVKKDTEHHQGWRLVARIIVCTYAVFKETGYNLHEQAVDKMRNDDITMFWNKPDYTWWGAPPMDRPRADGIVEGWGSGDGNYILNNTFTRKITPSDNDILDSIGL